MVNFVILSGGAGSRLWPKSREKLPKQFLKLTNDSTMLQNTLLRIFKIIENIKEIDNEIYVICNKDHSHIVENQIESMNSPYKVTIISEPKGRDSAAAICIAALLGNVETNTIIMPCDHVFNDEEFSNCCSQSLSFLSDSIVTFGIKPTRVETGYGYIKIDPTNYKTEQFVEKPNYEIAKQYYENGHYLWNAGVFVFKNKNMIDCFKKYADDIWTNCVNTLDTTKIVKYKINQLDDVFMNTRSISVDYAIMEPLCSNTHFEIGAITIPYDFYWNDIGSFAALYDEHTKTSDENVIVGDVLTLNTKNCFIDSENSFIATVGIENLVIVQTADAMVVCNKNQTQDIKKIVDTIKKENREEAFFHKKVFRPWGWYINIFGNDHNLYKVKSIAVYPGKRLSLQSHNHRSEHWVIVKGRAKVQLDTEQIILEKDQHVYIPVKCLHRIENISDEMLEFTETQIGNYLGEDDIIRYEDDFGRV
jgi:mannose-1-phosphate guanylyltransferase/mannose-6-phosphate isomerase